MVVSCKTIVEYQNHHKDSSCCPFKATPNFLSWFVTPHPTPVLLTTNLFSIFIILSFQIYNPWNIFSLRKILWRVAQIGEHLNIIIVIITIIITAD
jgi:hypothetical protein